MAKQKRIEIILTPRDVDVKPTFDLNAYGMEKYEVLGLLELASFHVKQVSLQETKDLQIKDREND